jgi:hypothetical protein
METKLERDVRFLRRYAVGATLACCVLVTAGFALQNRKQKFEEIDVERLNIVEKDGSPRVVISNKARSPRVMERGRVFGDPGGRAGLIFYNDERTEAGGLIFSGKMVDGKPVATASLTFDQYEQDQTLALQYVDSNGTRRAGLALADYSTTMTSREWSEKLDALGKMPDGPEKTQERQRLREFRPRYRMYIGRSRDNGASLVQLNDGEGRPRLQMIVETNGAARIEFLDQNGKVVNRMVPEK